MSTHDDDPRVITDVDGHVLRIVLTRAHKMNAFDLRMLHELAQAYTRYDDDPDLRCAVVLAQGDHFSAGLDLAEVGPAIKEGQPFFPDGYVDPLGLRGRVRKKPVVMAAQGYCLTIGIELLLSADIRLAAAGTKFGQIEINRGIFPFGGATIRLPQVAGWGNAMRWLLTGDRFDETEALRIGLVQEITSPQELQSRAMTIAHTIASRAPLGVQATLASSKDAAALGPEQAAERLAPVARQLMATEDAAEGLKSFVERREAKFSGR